MRARMLAIAGMVAAGLAACGSSAPGTAGTATATRTHSGAPAATGASPAVATPPAVGSACPPAGRRVSTAAELGDALGAATPGSSIVLAAGVYSGRFVASVPGTAAAPITLCGPATAVIDGGGIDSGYALHLDGASWWRVLGIGVRGGQKGVVLDHADHVLLSGMSVEGTGDEAVHLRAFSSDDTVEGLTIRQTGLLTPKFGEGIYVGSAKSNWCTYTACSPDACDDDVVRGNDIASTTAENIDVKEGTTGGVIAGNRLDGAGMVASAASAWVNVKGNSWTVTGNHGTGSIGDGFQVHSVLSSWGYDDVFTGNTADVDGPGYGFYVQSRSLDARVACDNVAVGAGSGLSNQRCG